MSLTSCIKKAGAALRTEDKNAVLVKAREYRGQGLSADDAARKAVDDQIAAVQALMDTPQKPQDLLGDAPNASQQAAEKLRKQKEAREQAQRDAAPAPTGFDLGMVDSRNGNDVAPGQMEIGKNPDALRAQADLNNALADLGDIFNKPFKANMTPEQEQKLLPVLTRVLDAAFRLGYHKFRDAAKFALDKIRAALGNEAADALTIQHLQGAYVAMSGSYLSKGAQSIGDVAAIRSIGELLGSTDAGIKPSTTQMQSDGFMADSETPTNSGTTKPNGMQGNRRSDIEALRSVDSLMRRIGKDRKILNAIVGLVPIDMVNVLGSQKLSPEDLFHNPSVLVDLAGFGGDFPVAERVQAASSVMQAAAQFAAKSSRPSELGWSSMDFDSALTALKNRHAAILSGSFADRKNEADNSANQEPRNVPSPNAGVERNSEKPAAGAAVGTPVPDVGAGPAAGTGAAGGQAGGSPRGGQSGGAGVSPGRSPSDRERGDQLIRGGRESAGPSGDDARTDFGERSGDSGITGVPPETIPASEVGAAANDGTEDTRKRNAQRAAAGLTVKAGDLQNVRDTLPYLLPGQQEDVHKAELTFAKPKGYGMLFTNGTGTGKTFTGLGIVKRFAMQGKENTLIVVPDAKIAADWIESGRALGLTITALEDTKDAGKGITLATYANLGANDALAKRQWDLVIPDESHSLMQSADGEVTGYLKNLRAITHHPQGVIQRYTMLNRPDIDRYSELDSQIVANNKIINKDDTMDVMRQSLQTENEKLEKELKPLRIKLQAAQDAVKEDVKARQGEKRTRLAFLSATPFAYEKTIDWANGYLFDYMEGYPYDPQKAGLAYNQPDPRQYYFMTRFGYTMRFNKLNEPGPKVDRGLLQRQFNAELKKAGVLSGRMLDVKADYDRRFVLVDSAIGNKIDAALEWLKDSARAESDAQKDVPREKRKSGMATLRDAIADQFDYLSRRYLLEAIKAEEVIPIVKQHLALGRKVVVFHDYKLGGSVNPFDVRENGLVKVDPKANANEQELQQQALDRANSFNAAVRAFRKQFPDLVNGLNDLKSPIEVFMRELPQTMLINGNEKPRDLLNRYKSFQDDSTGPQVMLVQSDKNKGWSGHDTTGKHQRVLINLGQPTAPTKAIQQEGRIYRTGQVSNAIMRYLNTGTNWEKWAFATQIANRASTAENLGMGELSRALKDSFIAAFEESDTYAPGHEGEGTGGKERDKASNDALTEYDRAKSFYWGTQKKNAKTKAEEGKDYFATPEPVGLKMVEWLDARGEEDLLEPSGGHGAIARWLPENAKKTVIEPSTALRSRLAMVMDLDSTKIIDGTFEDLNVVNKYDGIVMNPPFGSGGKTAIDHLAKAATHLRDGGRIVALIPTGPAAEKKFEKWFYEASEKPAKPIFTLGNEKLYRGDTLHFQAFSRITSMVLGRVAVANGTHYAVPEGGDLSGAVNLGVGALSRIDPGPRTETFKPAADLFLIADIKLPQVTFERAGTAVATRILVIEKQTDAAKAPDTRGTQNRDLTGIDDINDLFDRMEHIGLPGRPKVDEAPEPEPAKAEKPGKVQKPAPVAVEGDTITIDGTPYTVAVYTTNAGKDIKGVWLPTKAMALKYGPSTFEKRGLGFFLRERDFPKSEDGPPVAREPQAAYSTGTYETDLFGEPVSTDLFGEPVKSGGPASAKPAPDRVRGDAQPAGALQDTPVTPGDYYVTTLVGSEVTRELGAKRITTPAHAAAATQYLYKSAVERFDGIVTDANGKPLAVIGGFKGTLNQTSVYPVTLIAEAVRIKGAANIWFSHNHPSGKSTLSNADLNLNRMLTDVFNGSGIKPMGLLAVAGNEFAYVGGDLDAYGQTNTQIEAAAIPQATGKTSVPVMERTLGSSRAGDVLSAPTIAMSAGKRFYNKTKTPGLMLLTSQNQVAAWIPITDQLQGPLRDTGGLNAVYRAISESNAASAIIIHGGELSYQSLPPGPYNKYVTPSENIAAVLKKIGIPPLDSIDVVRMKSTAEQGLSIEKGPVYARGGQPFYSALAEGIQGIKAASAPATGWLDAIKGLVNKGAVKQHEVEWSGVTDWLKLQTGKVTKEQIAEYLDANGVKVTETVLGENNLPPLPDGWDVVRDEDGNGFLVIDDDGETRGEGETETEARRDAGDPDALAGTVDTKYDQYQLPGGTNYREVLLTLPEPAGDKQPIGPDQSPERAERMKRTIALQDQLRYLQEPRRIDRGETLEQYEARYYGEEAKRIGVEVEVLKTENRREWDAMVRAQKEWNERVASKQYRSGHWDQPNVLAHIRVNDRISTEPLTEQEQADLKAWNDGQDKLASIDSRLAKAQRNSSIQRDIRLEELRNELRPQVRAGKMTPVELQRRLDEASTGDPEVAKLSAERRALMDSLPKMPEPKQSRVLFVEEIQSDWGQDGKKQGFAGPTVFVVRSKDGGFITSRTTRESAETVAAQYNGTEVVEEKRGEGDSGIPAAPFVGKTDAWVSLALKRVIKMAVDGGYDKVAFVNGEQSAERYDLSKDVELIDWKMVDDSATGATRRVYVKTKNREAAFQFRINDKGDVVGDRKDDLSGKSLPDVLGKDIADKIMAEPAGELSGNGLKVGGEGMKAFYNQIVPSVTKDVIRKLGGGQLEEIQIAQTPGFDGNGVKAPARAIKSMQPGFTITPKMRERAADGVPLFARTKAFDAEAFRRAFAPPVPMSVTKVQAAVDQLTAKWTNGPDIKVVATPKNLPTSAPADARGLIHGGKVYIVASTNHNRDWLARTLGHEAIGHYGLWKMLGTEGMAQFQKNVHLAIKSGNKPLTAISQKVRRLYVDETGKFNLDAEDEANEIAAFAVEDAIDPATGEFRPGFGFLKSVYARVAQFLRDIGIDVAFTNLELQGMLVNAMKGLQAGKRLAGGGQTLVAAAARSDEAAPTVAPVSRHPARTPLYEAMRQLSRFEDAFQTNTSTAKDLATLAQEMTAKMENPPKFDVEPSSALHQGNRKPTLALKVTLPNGNAVKLLDIFEAKSDRPFVVIGNSEAGQAVGGSTAYQIAFAWAHNNGKTMRPDPAGLTVINRLRRTEAMISSAMHFGTTKHLEPHQDQYVALLDRMRQGGQEPEDTHYSSRPDIHDELAAMKARLWTNGTDPDSIAANVQHLVEASTQLAYAREPAIRNFEVADGVLRVRDGRAGAISLANLAAAGEAGAKEVLGVVLRPATSGVGASTLRRAAVAASVARLVGDGKGVATRAASQDHGNQRPDVAALQAIRKVLGQPDLSASDGLRGTFYARNDDLLSGYTPEEIKQKQQDEEAARKLEEQKPGKPASGKKVTADQVDMFNEQGSLFARGTVWDTPDPTRTDKIIYELQDGHVDLKRVHQAIEKSGQQIEEKWNARLAETLYPGRVAYRSQAFLKSEARPMLEAMVKHKIGMDELSDYLLARGAEERNVQIAKVNPKMPDGGAGTNTKGELMTTAASHAYLAGIPAARKAQLDTAAVLVDAITRGTRKLLVAEGLEKQSTIDAWERVYKNYVPMFKDEAESGMPPHPQGTGFAVKGSASRRAMGSTGEVTNMLAHVLMQREAAITRAEKNRVALALYGQALSHPNREFWTTIKPSMSHGQVVNELKAMGVDPLTAFSGMQTIPTIRSVDPVTNTVVDRPNPVYKNLPGAIPLKLNGEDRVVMLNASTERGLRLASSLKNLDGLTQLDLANSIIGKSTRWLAAVNTQYNPAFGLVNFTRDALGGSINLGSTELKGNALRVLARTPSAIWGIARELAGGSTGTWATLYKQFVADGGQTGYRENFRDPGDRAKDVQHVIARLQSAGKLSPGRFAHAMLDLLDGFNLTLENAVRLSAYKTALDKGMSRPEAARLGRELTVDFNRKGRSGREIGPLYAFFNASVQGTERTIQTLKGPTGKAVIAGGLSLGILQAMMLLAAGYDDDELQEFVKTRALIIPTNWTGKGEKKHIMIPYPLGLHVLPNTGRVIAELTLNGGKEIGRRTGVAISEIAGAFNPMGGGNIFEADGALKTIAPTLIDPLIELGFNKNFAGNPIERQGYGSETDNRPGIARTKESTQRSTTGQAYMAISKAINQLTGGTDYEAGLASPTPERVRYLAQTAGGGILRELEKTVNASTASARGEKTKTSQIPVLGRFAGEVDDDQVQTSRYFNSSKKLDKLESSMKAMLNAADGEALDAYIEKHPELALANANNRLQSTLSKLNKAAVQTINDPQGMTDIDEARLDVMRALNESVRDLEKDSGTTTLADRIRPAIRSRLAEATP